MSGSPVPSSESRRYPARPVVGVGALLIDGDSILLIERGTAPLKGEWSLPGGGVDTGETLEEAVRRETLEETGLVLGRVRQFEIFERIMRDSEGRPEYHYVLVDFLGKISGGDLRPGSDVSACRWVQQRDLPGYPLTEGTLAVIERAFQAK